MEAQMKLEHEIDFHWLILFALPTIFSSIFANLYTTVDGIFVAQWGQHGRPFRHPLLLPHDGLYGDPRAGAAAVFRDGWRMDGSRCRGNTEYRNEHLLFH